MQRKKITRRAHTALTILVYVREKLHLARQTVSSLTRRVAVTVGRHCRDGRWRRPHSTQDRSRFTFFPFSLVQLSRKRRDDNFQRFRWRVPYVKLG